MRLLNKFLPIFLSCLSLSCGSGPKVTTCISDPGVSGFDCSTSKGVKSVKLYTASNGFHAFPQDSAQKMLDYCAARKQQGTQAPQFVSCVSNVSQGGFACTAQSCVLNDFQNGILCKGGAETFVAYSQSSDYVAFSDPDTIQLLDYCNITLQTNP